MSLPPKVDVHVCVAPIQGVLGPYGYNPSLSDGIVFCILFGMSMILHCFSALRYRTWWQTVFAVGALVEAIGWAGRIWSSKCPYDTTPFLLQITTLVVAPAFFTAGIYIILGCLIHTLGLHLSPISPIMYLYIFCSADVLSLLIQAIGGASASIAYEKVPEGNTTRGTNIMVAGIIFQLASIAVFAYLFGLVIIRAYRNHNDVLRQKRIQYLVIATMFSVVLIVIRSIYRTIELLQGWVGYLFTTQRFFVVLDGAMMILAVGIFNIVQPRWAQGRNKGKKSITASRSELTGESIRCT